MESKLTNNEYLHWMESLGLSLNDFTDIEMSSLGLYLKGAYSDNLAVIITNGCGVPVYDPILEQFEWIDRDRGIEVILRVK